VAVKIRRLNKLTERIRITYRNGNNPIGVIVKAGELTIEQAILNANGQEFETNVYPGVMVHVGELAVQEPKEEIGTNDNPFVPDLDGKTVNDPWDEPNDEMTTGV
jgi:hypothetical protein